MSEELKMLKQYNEEEIRQLIKDKTSLVLIDDGINEFVARYDDIPDIIVDINEKFGYNKNLKVTDTQSFIQMLTTNGYFLNKCDAIVRNDIIDRLVDLQQGNVELKDYKIIDSDTFYTIKGNMKKEEMER